MSVAVRDRPTRRIDSERQVAVSHGVCLRRVYRVEMAGCDGTIGVWFVPMDRGGNACSSRSAVYPRQPTVDTGRRAGGNGAAARL